MIYYLAKAQLDGGTKLTAFIVAVLCVAGGYRTLKSLKTENNAKWVNVITTISAIVIALFGVFVIMSLLS